MNALESTKMFKTLEDELQNITEYWKNNAVDEQYGGFIGRRDHSNQVIPEASKGVILNTRILWSFSAVGMYKNDSSLRTYAERSFHYLEKYFRDQAFGGVFWELGYKGNPFHKRKQVYAQAFTIYGLSRFYLYTGKVEALSWAKELFEMLEEHAYDSEADGSLEAFAEDWSPIEDMRLSKKDMNSSKTMNTHLHILEAYTELSKVWKDPRVLQALRKLIHLFHTKFLNEDNHYELFFDTKWNLQSSTVSFGHDIEAAWLLVEAAKAINEPAMLRKTSEACVTVAKCFLQKAYIPKKGVLNELDRRTGVIDEDRHWWPQAEAMVGLLYAYEIDKDARFENALKDIWEFILKHQIDKDNGEWFFRIDKNMNPYKEEDKLGMWKCPYHNSRALIVLLEHYKKQTE